MNPISYTTWGRLALTGSQQSRSRCKGANREIVVQCQNVKPREGNVIQSRSQCTQALVGPTEIAIQCQDVHCPFLILANNARVGSLLLGQLFHIDFSNVYDPSDKLDSPALPIR